MKKTLFISLFMVVADSLGTANCFFEVLDQRVDAVMKIKNKTEFEKEVKVLGQAFELCAPIVDKVNDPEANGLRDLCGKRSWSGFPYAEILTSLWNWARS